MQLVSFWLASTALLVSGLVTAIEKELIYLAVGMCILGALSSVSFALLDRRTRALIQVAESLVTRRTGDGVPTQFAVLLESSDGGRWRVESYRFVIQGLELLTGFLFLVALVHLLAYR